MIEGINVEPATEEFLLWRCLHGGPLSRAGIDRYPDEPVLPWDRYRARNAPILAGLIRTYGACAIAAREGGEVVGMLRFYPRAVCDMHGAGGLCLQQDPPSGPDDDFAGAEFPPLARIDDKTLVVHCLTAGRPGRRDDPYRRKGLGSQMARTLIRWAGERGWERIEAAAFEDLPIIYETTGSAGHTFWEKLGFSLAERYPHPDLQGEEEFVLTLDAQARAAGIPPARARDKLVMRLALR